MEIWRYDSVMLNPYYMVEVITLTIGTKIQQTIASCESTLASLDSFALETQDKAAKQMFQQLAQQQKTIMDNLNQRLQYVQSEEPQYKQQ